MISQRTFLHRVVFGILSLFLIAGSVKETRALSVDEEKKLGKKVFLEMEGKVEIVRDLSLQSFIDRVGHALVAQAGSTPFEFKFYLIKGSDPNAFAIPGGIIFLTTGLMILAENEHEVAGVLSHEIAHVTARHVAQMIERSKRRNLATLAAMVAGILIGAGGGGKASEAVTATAMATAEALALEYTRENEVEADQTGLPCMIKAGYDPQAMITFLNKVNKFSLTYAPKIPTYLSTHPGLENRISFIENLLQLGEKPARPFRAVENFKRIQTKTFVEEREPHIAVTHFQSLVDANPQELDGYFGLGLAYRKMGRLDKSLEVFQKVYSIVPEDPDILRELGVAYLFTGKLDQSIEKLEAVPSPFHHDLSRLYSLGRAYQEKGDLNHALPLFQKIQREMPEFNDVYFNMGSVYGRMGQKGLSHYYFGKHFKLRGDKNNALLHFRTSLEWLEKGSSEREEAQREIKELIPSRPAK
jgi:predicted Zn-dependent protease